jgi:hypothetical protein
MKANYFMGHFKGYFEGTKTFLNPQLSSAPINALVSGEVISTGLINSLDTKAFIVHDLLCLFMNMLAYARPYTNCLTKKGKLNYFSIM